MVKAVSVLLFLLVTACGGMSRVQATVATADGVTYRFPADQRDEATRQAMLYCANLGRSAVLKSTEPDGGDLTVAAYDCR